MSPAAESGLLVSSPDRVGLSQRRSSANGYAWSWDGAAHPCEEHAAKPPVPAGRPPGPRARRPARPVRRDQVPKHALESRHPGQPRLARQGVPAGPPADRAGPGPPWRRPARRAARATPQAEAARQAPRRPGPPGMAPGRPRWRRRRPEPPRRGPGRLRLR
jgi:hypothetical protein